MPRCSPSGDASERPAWHSMMSAIPTFMAALPPLSGQRSAVDTAASTGAGRYPGRPGPNARRSWRPCGQLYEAEAEQAQIVAEVQIPRRGRIGEGERQAVRARAQEIARDREGHVD